MAVNIINTTKKTEMIDTIDCIKQLMEEKVPHYRNQQKYINIANIVTYAAYRLVYENKLKERYDSFEQAKPIIRNNLTRTLLESVIKERYTEEYSLTKEPTVAVKWANIVTDIEELFNTSLDREIIGLYDDRDVFCCCGEKCYFTEYRKRKVWRCPVCGAMVGVHTGTNIPLGVPASREVGRKRLEVHREIDRIVRSGMGKSHVYKLLSRRMNLSPEKTHAGLFNEEQCDEALDVLKSIEGTFYMP